MPHGFVFFVEIHRVSLIDTLEYLRKRDFQCLYQEVHVIIH